MSSSTKAYVFALTYATLFVQVRGCFCLPLAYVAYVILKLKYKKRRVRIYKYKKECRMTCATYAYPPLLQVRVGFSVHSTYAFDALRHTLTPNRSGTRVVFCGLSVCQWIYTRWDICPPGRGPLPSVNHQTLRCWVFPGASYEINCLCNDKYHDLEFYIGLI